VRMWMVDTGIMCRQHLLGEHVEHHMFAAHFAKKRGIDGYVEHNCVEPKSLQSRHKALVKEMRRRGFNHNSPLKKVSVRIYPDVRVNKKKALKDLLSRCKECCKRYKVRKRG